jgi:hypothetical protein
MHPEISIGSGRYLILVEQLATVPRRTLGPVVATTANEYAITAALDMLFTGI